MTNGPTKTQHLFNARIRSASGGNIHPAVTSISPILNSAGVPELQIIKHA